MTPDELLARMATTLRTEIGPVVEGTYQRTQAFMAAVVLEKSAREVRLGAEHAAADEHDTRAMLGDVEAVLAEASVPAALRSALDGAAVSPGAAGLCTLVDALYGARAALGDDTFAAALGRVRVALRASIDRRLEIAR
jgi:hypothetical protein